MEFWQLQDLACKMRFPNMSFAAQYDLEGHYWIRVRFQTVDWHSGKPVVVRTDSNPIDMDTADEDLVVERAFDAVMHLLEHEAGELFSFRGRLVFHPHHPVNAAPADIPRQRLKLAPRDEVPVVPITRRILPERSQGAIYADSKGGNSDRTVPLAEYLGGTQPIQVIKPVRYRPLNKRRRRS